MALYSMGYIARHYGVSPSTIRRWEASGKIPASIRTLGGHRRFEKVEDKQSESESMSGTLVCPRMTSAPIWIAKSGGFRRMAAKRFTATSDQA